jgi:hypothetical protein
VCVCEITKLARKVPTLFLGSRAIVGSIPEKVFAAKDAEGKTFLDALRDGGFAGTREAVVGGGGGAVQVESMFG